MGLGNRSRHNRALLTQSDTDRNVRRIAGTASGRLSKFYARSRIRSTPRWPGGSSIPLKSMSDSWQHEECKRKVDTDSSGVGPRASRARPARRAGAMRSASAAGREDGRLRITFHGAARQVTGSAHLLEIGRHRILLDCGLFDSDRIDPDSPNRQFTFEPRDLDAVIVSHAHNDHIGRLPCLVRAGYNGPIYATAGHRRHHSA